MTTLHATAIAFLVSGLFGPALQKADATMDFYLAYRVSDSGSVKQKAALLKKVNVAYDQVQRAGDPAETVYAFHQKGLAQEHFADKLLQMPDPKELTAEQIVIWRAEMRFMAGGYLKTATNFYEAAVQHAVHHKVDTEYVTRSRSRLKDLEKR